MYVERVNNIDSNVLHNTEVIWFLKARRSIKTNNFATEFLKIS